MSRHSVHTASPSPYWSLVQQAGAAEGSAVRAALIELCQAYWYPLYAFVRRRGHGVQDARGLTQAFVLELIDGPLLSRAGPEKVRFRSFVLGALEHFLADPSHRQRAGKGDGGIEIAPLDEARDETRFSDENSTGLSAAQQFERAWAFSLLDSVLRRLRSEYLTAGHVALFDALQPFLAVYRVRGRYAALSATLGLSEEALATAMYRLRRRYAAILREEIGRTVSEPGEVEAEIAYLQAAVAR